MIQTVKTIVIGSLIILGFEAFYFFGDKPNTLVLGEKEEITFTPSSSPSETPTDSPTQEPTPSPTIIPTPIITPSPTPIPQPKFSSQQINEFIDRFAAQYNVDPHLLRAIALCESGFDPFAKSLSYVGLYQFGPNTWKNIRKQMGEDSDISLRANAEEAVQTAAYSLHINNAGIWPNCVH